MHSWAAPFNHVFQGHSEVRTDDFASSPTLVRDHQLAYSEPAKEGHWGEEASTLHVPEEQQPGNMPHSIEPLSYDRCVAESTIDAQYEQSPMTNQDFHNHTEIANVSPLQIEPEVTAARKRIGDVDRFVHSLCGKAFASKSGVKKHHWGGKIGDRETITGCWAKHKKPDVSWDEHPSCKESAAKANVPHSSRNNTARKGTDRASLARPQKLVGSDFKTLSDFPTLQDLPRTVAETIHPSNTMQPRAENFVTSHSHEGFGRSSFESLLLAVNAAAQMDAPKLQGRNDSVVSHQIMAEARGSA